MASRCRRRGLDAHSNAASSRRVEAGPLEHGLDPRSHARDAVTGRGCTILMMFASDGAFPVDERKISSSARDASQFLTRRFGSEPSDFRPVTPLWRA